MSTSYQNEPITHNLDAEFEVLAACIKEPDNIDKCDLKPDDFWDAGCREVFSTLVMMQERCLVIDAVTVSEYLPKNGSVNRVGGLVWLGEVMANTVGSSSRFAAYAGIIKEYKRKRDLAAAGSKIAELATSTGSEYQAAVQAADELIMQLSSKTATENDTVAVKDVLTAYLETLENRQNSGMPGIPTGLDELDRMIGGLQKTKLYIVGARPSMGKTAFANGLALSAASTRSSAYGEGDHGVLFFEQEMPTVEMMDRIFSSAGSINLTSLVNGQLTDDDYTRLGAALGKIHEMPFWINDKPAQTLSRIRAEARARKREGNLSVIFVDYLQLMQGPGEKRNDQIQEISRGLKQIAMELDVAVVALSQLSRKCEERTDKRPMMSDLRESGSIEQDADVIMFLYRDEKYNENTQDVGIAEIIIEKQRNGPTGTVKAQFRGEYTRFDNIRSGYSGGGY